MPSHALHNRRAPCLLPLSMAISALCGTEVASAQNEATPTAKLREVVVSAAGFEQDIKQAPASIAIITRQQLEQQRFSNLAQALEHAEGVDVGAASDKTGGLNISIRGMPSEYTLVLIDDKRQNSPGNVTPNNFGGTQTSFLPPLSAIERIEVIRGPMSTLYGSDAMGGVVNIITRKVANSWTGAIGADYTWQQESEFGNNHAQRFYLSGPIKPELLGISLRASQFHRNAAAISYIGNGNQQQIPKMGSNPVKSDIATLGGRLSLTPNRYHDIVLDLEAGRQSYDNSRGQLGTLGNGGYAPEQKYQRDRWSISHSGRYGFGNWDNSYMVNQTETIGRTIPPKTPNAIAGSPRTLKVQSRVFDTKLTLPWGQHLSTVGGQWWDAKMQDGIAPKPFAFTQQAIFAEDEWQLADGFRLTLGLRHDRHNIFGSKTSPRIYGVWNLTPQWTLKGGISNGYKTPNVEQLANSIIGFGGQGKKPLIGSPGLKPETSRSTELGLHFNNAPGFSASATLFDNQFKDKITAGPGLLNCSYSGAPNRAGCVDFGTWPAVDSFGQKTNVDQATTRGLELSTRYAINHQWTSSANYTYTSSEQKSGTNKGKPLTDAPKHTLNARLEWKPSDQWSAWLSAEYRSHRWRDPGNTAESQVAAQKLGNYKGYTQLHLGGNYRVNRQFSINAGIYNLLNKNFVDYQPYSFKDKTGITTVAYSNLYRNPQEGRRLWLSANYEF